MLSSLFLPLLDYCYKERKWSHARMMLLLRLSQGVLGIDYLLLLILVRRGFHALLVIGYNHTTDPGIMMWEAIGIGCLMGYGWGIVLAIFMYDYIYLRDKTYFCNFPD